MLMLTRWQHGMEIRSIGGRLRFSAGIYTFLIYIITCMVKLALQEVETLHYARIEV